MNLNPVHTDFMDRDMMDLWWKMKPGDLKNYRLQGGTALAMYLNHRKSTDFDFFRMGPVTRDEIEKFTWLKGSQFRGTGGMVDVVVPASQRNIILNFISIKAFNGIRPTQRPLKAANGVYIAHTIDILTGKLSAMSQRKAVRDFFDIASAHAIIPDELQTAVDIYLRDAMTLDNSRAELAKTVITYPQSAEYELPGSALQALDELANSLMPSDCGPEKTDHEF